MAAYHLLGQVLQRFQEEQIRVIPLKGATADQVYGDIGLRRWAIGPAGSADNFQRRPEPAGRPGFHLRAALFGRGGRRPAFPRAALLQRRIVIELHWKLVLSASPVQIDIADLWERARRITLENCQPGLWPRRT